MPMATPTRSDACGRTRNHHDAIGDEAFDPVPEKRNGRFRGRSGDSCRSVKDQ